MAHLKRLVRFAVVMCSIVAVLTASLAIAAPQVVKLVSAHRSDHERILLDPLSERSYIYDALGGKMATLIDRNNENRVQVPLDQVPETVKGAVLAVEDENFYAHTGINVRSIFRAVDANLNAGGVSQGGSTITQQVVKNSLVGDEQNLSRKFREAFLAIELEKQMSKDEILERYLNSVYFGGGAYGVQAASQYYFNKEVKDLDWADGALLAALIRSPNSYDPFKNPKLAKQRRKLALDRLVVTKRLSQAEADLYQAVPLPEQPTIPVAPNDYFTEKVKQELLDNPKYNLGETAAARNQMVFSGGISVETTFNPYMQELAKQSRNDTLPNHNGDGTFNVTNPENGSLSYGTQAIASIEPETGAVRVLVGGPGYERDKSQADLTGLPGRPPGSTMKTFVLATLFEQGYLPGDTVNTGSCSFKVPGETKPYSVSGGGGFTTIEAATKKSSNCGFLRLSQVAGVENVVAMARRLGVRSTLHTIRPDGTDEGIPFGITLGTVPIAPIDMAAAYAVFANDGVQHEPYMIERIRDRNGKVLYQHQTNPRQVISPQVARLVNQVMLANVEGGTGRNAKIANGQPAGGKTGTTNESTNVWFVGYTPKLSTAIWMGAPSGEWSLAQAGLGGATGGRYPAKTWGEFYSRLLANTEDIFEFPEPEKADRRAKSVGKIPNEIGGRSSPTRRPRQPSNPTPTTVPNGGTPGGGGGNGEGGTGDGGGTPTTEAPAPPSTVPPTAPGTPGFAGG